MRTLFSFALAAVLFSTLAFSAEPRLLHVATDGDDAWSGRPAAPNAGRTDGPLASLAGARDAIRRIRAQGDAQSITVRVRGGVYRLAAPFTLDPLDSGTAEAPTVYEAEPGHRPIFSGGRAVSGFRQNGPLWEVELPQVKAGQWYFRQLFVNGQRRNVARSPNDGYHRIAALIPGPAKPNTKAVAPDRFIFTPGDIKPWSRLSDAHIVLMHSWETSIHPIKSIDEKTNTVHFAAPLKEWWSIGHWESNQRYYVENARELLDRPGEWYLNRETGVLSYWPMPGEKLGETEIVAPVLPVLVRFAGNADEGRFVRHVTLRDLAFHHADWVLNPRGNSSTQAAVEVPAAVMADGALDCVIERCEVAHVGGYGIWFQRGCKDGRLQQNRLFDLGAGGIRVGEAKMAKADVAETSRTLVDNNHIFDGGHVYAGAVGIWVAQSSHNRISHNDVHDLRYTGISVGWNWGLEPNRTHHNTIEFNHVHNLGHGVMSDAGLIYCLGVSSGSIIRNNVFHDMWPYSQPAFGWGIYLDAQCGQYTVENNLVYNTQSGGLMFSNGGHAHTIRNNIFALSATHALWPYSEKRPSTFRRNIVYLTQGALLIPYGERSLNERLAAKESPGDWDENLYWHTGGEEKLRFYRRSFAEWQAIGLDGKSRIADPQFADAEAHDFRLKPGSPAMQLGFEPLDISRAGLYGDAAWVAESRHVDCPRRPLPPPPAPPKPTEIDDDFEKTAAGMPPARATVSGEKEGASIRISEDRAAAGRRSLKITDSKSLKPSWEPHFFYQPHFTTGTIRQSFDVWFSPSAQFFTEWRDDAAAAYPGNVGPSVRFDGNGGVTAGGKVLAKVPAESWVHVEIEAALGKDAPRTFKLTITPAGGSASTFADLPIPGAGFRELHWLGFSSTAAADTVFYLDNLKITPVPAAPPQAIGATQRRPNIILILGDDMGYGDLGCYGNRKIRTPHIDRLAAEGVRFTDFYVPAPVCTPARGALLTGRYPIRNGLSGLFWPHSTEGIDASEITMAEMLRDTGYTTGLIGKWHLGHQPEYLPMRHGFDYWYGMPYPNDMDGAHPLNEVFKKAWPPLPLYRNEQLVEQPIDLPNLTSKYAQECVSFIEKNKDRPFFLFYAPAMPHTYLAASAAFRGKSAHGLYGDTIEELDWSVGQIAEALKTHGLDRNTLIFFTNDNGPVMPGQHGRGGHPEREKQFFPDGTYGDNAGLRGGKQSTFEGGVRGPAIAWAPGRIAAGHVEQAPAIIMDLLPTIAAFTGAKLPQARPIDGEDLIPVLRRQGQRQGGEFCFFNATRMTGFRSDNWKLKIETAAGKPDTVMLFDLNSDPGEKVDMAGQRPDVLQRLQRRMTEIEQSFGAVPPTKK